MLYSRDDWEEWVRAASFLREHGEAAIDVAAAQVDEAADGSNPQTEAHYLALRNRLEDLRKVSERFPGVDFPRLIAGH